MNDKQWEQQFEKLAKASGMNAMPQPMRDKLMGAFRQHHATKPSRLQKFFATLSLDSFATLLPQGAREAQLPTTRQLFYICSLGDIALDCISQGDELIVSGQLFFNRNHAPFQVTVTRENGVVGTSTTKKNHNFRLTLPAGVADLTLSNETHSVTLENVPLELARG